jgi:hypothetical protein
LSGISTSTRSSKDGAEKEGSEEDEEHQEDGEEEVQEVVDIHSAKRPSPIDATVGSSDAGEGTTTTLPRFVFRI